MQCVILAAGRGTRMGELTENVPKPMLPLLGKPMLEWKLEMLPEAIDEVVFIIGYHGNQIERYFGDRFGGKRISYVVQDVLNGTGGALALTNDIVSERFLVAMGDDLYAREDLERLLAENLAVLAYETDRAEPYGLLDTDARGNLTNIVERPHGRREGLVNAAAYMLDRRIFDEPFVSINGTEFGLPQALVALGRQSPVRVVTTMRWQPLGSPEDIPRGEAFLKRYWL